MPNNVITRLSLFQSEWQTMRTTWTSKHMVGFFYIIGSVSRFLLKSPGLETSSSSFMVPSGCELVFFNRNNCSNNYLQVQQLISLISIVNNAGKDGSVKQIMASTIKGRRFFSCFAMWQSLQQKMTIKSISGLYRLVSCGCLILNCATGLRKHG